MQNWRGPYLVIYVLLHWTLEEGNWNRHRCAGPQPSYPKTPVDGLVDATYRKCALMAAAPLAIALGCLAIASRSAIAIGSRQISIGVAAVVFGP